MTREPIPRLPVFGWQALRGGRDAAAPCLLDLPHLHFSTSGRASILLALEALKIAPGDEVLLPTYHCPTMVAPAACLQAVPRFYPIDASGCPDLGWLGSQDLRRVRALLAAHYFGLPRPMEALRRWCEERRIALIEDCAHALFGQVDGRPVGSWGDIAIASLTKFLPVPEGGCLVMNLPALQPPSLQPCAAGREVGACIDILEVGALQGRLTGLNTLVSGSLGVMRRLRGTPAASAPAEDAPSHDAALNARPASSAAGPSPIGPVLSRSPSPSTSPSQPQPQPPLAADGLEVPAGDAETSAGRRSAAAGVGDFTVDGALAHRRPAAACRWIGAALPRERIVRQRRANYAWLLARLSGHAGLRPLLPAPAPALDAAPYVFPLWVDEPDPGYAELRRLGMPVFRWDRLWPGVPRLPGDRGLLWSHHVLQLACHQDLDGGQLDAFATALLRLYAGPAASPQTARPATVVAASPH